MKHNDSLLATQLKQLTQSFLPDMNFQDQEEDFLLTNIPENWERDQKVVTDLYQHLKLSHPEADNSYWLTRTCTLLVWQPIYVALVSIYGLHHVPSFSEFKQGRRGTELRGMYFSSITFHFESTERLIELVGKELSQSFEYYRELLDDAYRCRPHFMQALLGDILLTALLQLKKYSPTLLSPDYVLQQSHLWLAAFGLPATPEGSFVIAQNGVEIDFTRKSCCFVYKKTDGKLCSNCPRN
ncbi:siderophore ferric iron reductase [Vibrio sp. RC27]